MNRDDRGHHGDDDHSNATITKTTQQTTGHRARTQRNQQVHVKPDANRKTTFPGLEASGRASSSCASLTTCVATGAPAEARYYSINQ